MMPFFLCRIFTIGICNNYVLYMNILTVIVVRVRVEAYFLRRNQGGQDVASIVQDGIRCNCTEIAALGLKELCVDRIQDGVCRHTVEVCARLCKRIGQCIAVSFDTDIFP